MRVRSLPTTVGQGIGRVAADTTWQYYAQQLDNDNNTWYLISPISVGPFGESNGTPAWIPSGSPAGYAQETYLEEIDCGEFVNLNQPNNTMTEGTQIREDAVICIFSRNEYIPSGWTDHQFLTFVLAHESAYDVQNAIQHAFTIRSRMLSDYFPDTVMDVILQHDCTGVAAFSAVKVISGDSANLSLLYNAQHPDSELVARVQAIAQVADALLTGGDFSNTLLPFSSINSIAGYAAYTMGIRLGDCITDLEGNTDEEKSNSFRERSQESQRDLLIDCLLQSCTCTRTNETQLAARTRLQNIYAGHVGPARGTSTSPLLEGFVSIFFTDNHNCGSC